MNTKYIITKIGDNLVSAIYKDNDNNCHYLKVLDSGSCVGNIYIGRVENVVKNIDAAFVEFNNKEKGYFSLKDNPNPVFLNNKNNNSVNIGDRLLVQIEKEPVKTKPATLTSKIEITGNYVVISNDFTGINVSKKLKKSDYTELIEEARKILIEKRATITAEIGYEKLFSCGVILRSNCLDAPVPAILEDLKITLDKYLNIIRGAIFGSFYTCLYENKPDYYNDCVHLSGVSDVEIITDLPEIHKELSDYFKDSTKINTRLYEDELLPLYKLYSIEKEIDEALSKKVWLKSGGYLIIEQTEALCVVDVNSGKCVPKSKKQTDIEKSALKVNLEACDKLMNQLMLRNISGIIVVDFINMDSDENVEAMMSHLKMLAKNDIVSTQIIDITKLGLVEITRKRTGKCLAEMYKK